MIALEVGVDLVQVGDIEEAIAKFGDRYLRRIYTSDELTYAGPPGPQRALRLAARFAAKEAVIKVLRPRGEAVPWRDIGVLRGEGGALEVCLSGRAAALASTSGIDRVSISVTHDGALAAAVAVAVRGTPASSPGSAS